MTLPHASVLINEILDFFEDRKIKVFIDGTLGAGGHSEGLLKAHPEIETLIGIDQDPSALAIAESRLEPWKEKIQLIPGNFSVLSKVLADLQIPSVDGILFDLGVSSMQLDRPEKGFSFMHEGPLDMRMNPACELTAAEIVNHWPEHELGKIFREYGEEKQWRAAARAIVKAREAQPILTTLELANVIRSAVFVKKKGFNPATLIFQALRICVNNELGVLEEILPHAISHLNSGGRLAVISFHSLEDRLVKNAMRFAASDKFDTSGLGGGLFLDKDPLVKLITHKPVTPSEQEIATNPRSRSAKLRVVEKI